MKTRFSFFLPIVIVLTLILLTVFIFVFIERSKFVASSPPQTPVVSVVDYQIEVQQLMKTFLTDYEIATDQSTQMDVTEKTLTALLNVRVPASEKDTHLSLALSLQQLKQNLSANSPDTKTSFIHLKDILSKTDWLHL